MSDLRSDAIQAIAEEVCESYGEEGPCDDHVRKAGSVLDALLDFLEAHTEEWRKEAKRYPSVPPLITEFDLRFLIAALRVEP